MTLFSVLAQTPSQSMVLNGKSTPERLENVLIFLTGGTVDFVFQFRANYKRVQQYFQ